MKKISHKISMAMIASILSVTLLLGAISMLVGARVVKNATEKNLTETSGRLAEKLNHSTETIETKLEDLAITISHDVDMSKMKNDPEYPTFYTQKIIPLVTDYAKSGQINVDCYVNFLNEYSRDGYIIGPNVINPDGKGFRRVDFGTKISDMIADPKAYDWYYKPIEQQSGYWTDPYQDVITGFYMVSYVTPIFIDGKVEGVVGMDIKFDTLRSIVDEAKVYDTGYASMMDSDYNFLVHPTFDFEDNLRGVYDGGLEPLAKAIDEKDHGVVSLKVDSVQKYISFARLSNGNILLVSVTTKEVFEDVYYLGVFLGIATVFGLFLAVYFALFISSKIATPINNLNERAKEIAEGKLDVTIPIETEDEIGQFAKTFNYMIASLVSANTELTAVFEELTATEEELRDHYDRLQVSEAALRLSDARYQLAVEGSNDVIWEIDAATGNFYASTKLYELLGYKLNSFTTIYELNQYIHTDDFDYAKADLYNYMDRKLKSYHSTYRVRKSDGEYLWFFSRGKGLWDENGNIIKVAGSISDITDKKIAEDKINFLAYHDDLTKLPNRFYFLEKLEGVILNAAEQSLRGAVFYLDIDDFKIINDTLGHSFGDKVLCYYSEQLKKILGENDILCRIGGDEFVIIHCFNESTELEQFAELILSLFRDTYLIEGKRIYLSTSFGVAEFPKDGVNSDALMKNADFAMYKAKETGKNKYSIYNEKLYIQLQRKIDIERVLRNAIEENELSVVFQPQVYVSTQQIYGFEALIRLNSKELGFVSPGEFIPIAEESGFITVLDHWVFSQSCNYVAKWIEKGYTFESMSVNISSNDIRRSDFVDLIRDMITSANIDPKLIELEITETVLMEQIETVTERLEQLRNLGIRVALDDFGTGYSSLNYLRSIPIDTLKIDKSFIDHITENTNEEVIISNIIQLAQTMNLKVVAEGVETKAQYELLKSKNCDYVQGYYFSKPVSPVEIETMFEI